MEHNDNVADEILDRLPTTPEGLVPSPEAIEVVRRFEAERGRSDPETGGDLSDDREPRNPKIPPAAGSAALELIDNE